MANAFPSVPGSATEQIPWSTFRLNPAKHNQPSMFQQLTWP